MVQFKKMEKDVQKMAWDEWYVEQCKSGQKSKGANLYMLS